MEQFCSLPQSCAEPLFITVGEVMLRLTPPNYDKIRVATMFEASYGGSEANIALALANLGVDSQGYMVISFDGNFHSALWTWEEARDFCTQCLPYVDVLLGIELYHLWRDENDPNNDIPAIIRTLKGRIPFAHVRNTKHNGPGDFEEAAHLSSDGDLDMYEIMKALYETCPDVVIRPDHGRMVWGEVTMPGYGLYDRATGACYLNGLWEAIEKSNK